MQARSSDEAFKVSSKMLEDTAKAILSGDFDSFFRCIKVPQTVMAMDGSRALLSRDDVWQVFQDVRQRYTEIGLSKFDRRPEIVLFDGPDTIRFSYSTDLLSESGDLLQPRFLSMSRLEKHNGRWLIAGMQYGVDKKSAMGSALLQRELSETSDRYGASGMARDIVQGYLDKTMSAITQSDADLFCETVQLPLFVQGSNSTYLLSTIEETKADFQRQLTQLKVHGVSDVVRRVIHAEMMGDKRIYGSTHTYILNRDQLVIPAYKTALTLEQSPDLNWRVTSVVHPLGQLTLDTLVNRRLGRPAGGSR